MESERRPGADGTKVSTTHAGWGAGHPHVVATSDSERLVHALDCDLTHIGSAEDVDLHLPEADALHTKILHDTNDEYVLTMVGDGATRFGPTRCSVLGLTSQQGRGNWSSRATNMLNTAGPMEGVEAASLRIRSTRGRDRTTPKSIRPRR